MRHRDRRTVCVSSQSGCPLKCTFCATGVDGPRPQPDPGRDRRAGARARAHAARRRSGRVTNVVMMGMGEPFLNYDEVLAACRTLNDPDGLRPRRAPDRDLDRRLDARHRAAGRGADAGAAGALAARAQRRAARRADAGQPPLSRWRELMAACRGYRERTGRRIFIEYLLLDGVNDADEHAAELGRLLRARRLPRQPDRLQPDRGRLPRLAARRGWRAFAARARRAGVPATYRALARPRHRRRLRPAGRRGDVRGAAAP